MITLILSVCISTANPAFQECEAVNISQHYTMQQCAARMDKEMAKTKKTGFYFLDWEYECIKEID